MATRLSRSKRRCKVAPAPPDSEEALGLIMEELEDLRLFRHNLLQPVNASGTFDLNSATEKVNLARQLWSGGYLESMAALREANGALHEVLSAQVANQHDRRASIGHKATKVRLVDGVLLNVVRAQSKFNMPLVTAALSILAETNQVPREFWLAIRAFFHGSVAVESWVDGLLTVARDLRPPPAYQQLAGVAVGVFDNLSMKMNYGSYMRDGGSGERKDMTNWFWCDLPTSLARPGFDANELASRDSFFRRDRSIGDFCRSFYLDSPDIAANRSSRWTKWLRAIQNGVHLARPRVRPKWRPHKMYQPPIFDRLQSSYDDVRFELNTMRAALPGYRFLFAAGDGLTLMRMNHLLAQQPDVYFDQSPAIIPVQGEHPHGFFHLMHCQWRLYRPFIMKCAEVVGNEQVKRDPSVSDLNVTRFFLINILTRAAGEYILELCRDSPDAEDWDDPGPFMAKAAANVSFEWLCHFLHDNAFMCMEFLDSVRGFDSHKIDILWREFFASAHTDTAHKTQYVGMSLLRVFWGQCMVPELDEVYHAMRSMPSGDHEGCGVGWDWPIELLNGSIKSHVDMHVSEEQILKFIENWPMLEEVQRHMRDILYSNRAERHWRGRDVDADVDSLKKFFRANIGATWLEAIRPNTSVKVTSGHERKGKPWKEIADVMARRGAAAPHAYIRDYVQGMTPYFDWLP